VAAPATPYAVTSRHTAGEHPPASANCAHAFSPAIKLASMAKYPSTPGAKTSAIAAKCTDGVMLDMLIRCVTGRY
jgi:hypothetical protein